MASRRSPPAFEREDLHPGHRAVPGGWKGLCRAVLLGNRQGMKSIGGPPKGTSPAGGAYSQTGESKGDGAQAGNVLGCYVHGLFDWEDVAQGLLQSLWRPRA